MKTLLLFAASSRSDPTLSIILGIGVVAALAVGIYASIKFKQKADSSTDKDWQEAAKALGLEVTSAWKQWIMNGSLNGRQASIMLKSVPVVTKWTTTEARHLFCQITFERPLGVSFSIEPQSAYLLGSLGRVKTDMPEFDDTFELRSEDPNAINRLLMAPPETMDGRVLAEEMIHRTTQKGQRICLTDTALELAVIATDTSEGLTERIRNLAEQTIDLADVIEMRARSVRETVLEKFP